MPKVFHRRSGSWTEVKSIFHKRNGAWTEVLNVFRRTSGAWVKVFSAVKVPGNTVAPTITGTGYLFSTLTNNSLGTWTNSPTAYTRQWRRGNPSSGGGEPTSYSNISGATSSTYTTTSSDDGKYIICRITATNAVGSNTVSSNSIYVNKYAPDAFGTYSVSGGLLVGSTLTATAQIGTWKVTTDNTDDTYPDTFIYEWSDTNGNILQATSSDTYLIASGDLNKTLRLRVQGTNTGGDAYTEYQNLGTVTSVYRFAFGNNLYVSSNGHIGLDSGSSSYTSMSAGRNIAVFVKDFQQYYLAEYSNSSVYYLYIKGYLYDSSASSVNALDYQIKFYNDPSINYCDIYIVRKGSNVAALSDIDPGYYSSGTNGYAGMVGPYFIGAGTVFRVYFGDQAGTTSGIPWTAVNDNLWDVIQTWTGEGAGGLGIDDTFTTVTSAANQSAPFPTNTVAPTLTTNTENFSAGSVITVNAGSWNNASSYGYELLYGTFTPIADNSTATKPLINTNQYVITNTDATASSYYFRGRVTGYYDLSQTGNSTIALTETSARSTIIPSTTISVGTATSSGFTISGTASPTAYTTIPEIQIWNSSQTSQVATITTGLPTVNTSTGAWSYVWTGGSSSTTYYARVKVRSTDSDQTTVTTGFSSSITTSAGVSTPTSLTATNNSGAIRLTFSGGSGDQYDVYYANSNTRPTDGQAFADYPNVISPYDPPLTARDITRWFWVRKSTGSTRSNWYPSGSGVSIRLPLFAPPTPVITNSAQSTSSLSWHWTQPTPSASQDQPTSWDYNISTSTSTPSSWTNRTTRPTSSSPLVTSSLSADTTYYLHVRAKNADSSTTTYQSGTTSAVTTYTLSYSANNGSSTPSSQTGASGDTITLAANAGTRSGFTFGGWNIGGTTYSGSGSYTFGSANATATAIWDAVFVEPTTSAPALQFRRLTGSQYLRWYCDYPSVSNGTIIGMGWQLSTTESTAGLLNSGTRAYPGAFTYPYNVSGVGWAFKAGVDGQVSDISYSSSARYGRARVVMQGTNGLTYYGAWSSWI